jgi:DNA-directed RNA polymerase specialized sigma subunit
VNLSDYFAQDSTSSVDNKLDAQKAIEKLGHVDRAILYLYVIGHTQGEIACILGYSDSQISRLLDKMQEKP